MTVIKIQPHEYELDLTDRKFQVERKDGTLIFTETTPTDPVHVTIRFDANMLDILLDHLNGETEETHDPKEQLLADFIEKARPLLETFFNLDSRPKK